MRKAKDVVDEEQHVEAFIAKIFRDRQPRKRHAQTSARRFSHLTIDQRYLGLAHRVHVDFSHVEFAGIVEVFVKGLAKLDHLRLDHFAKKVVSFAGPFAYATKDREAPVFYRHVVYELHNQHGLPDPGAAEQTNLAAAHKWLDQIDDLDARLKHLQLG